MRSFVPERAATEKIVRSLVVHGLVRRAGIRHVGELLAFHLRQFGPA